MELSIGEVYRAQMVLKDVARHPKIIGPTNLSDKCSIYLKPENLQHTGSFKLRGAYYKISQLTPEMFSSISLDAEYPGIIGGAKNNTWASLMIFCARIKSVA